MSDVAASGASSWQVLVLLLGMLPGLVCAASDDQWFSVRMNGTKVGYALHRHAEIDGRNVDLERTVIALKSIGRANRIETELRFESDPAGNLLGYSSHVRSLDVDRVQHGSVSGNVVQLRSNFSGIEQRDHIELAPQTRWQQQEWRWLRSAPLQQGRQDTFAGFDAMLGVTIPVELSVRARTPLGLPGDPRLATQIVRTAHYADHIEQTTTYVDDDVRPLRIVTDVAGLPLELLAGSQADAEQPDQPVDYLARLLVRSPFRIGPARWNGHLRYTLTRRDGLALRVPATGEQRMRGDGTKTIIDICATCGNEIATSAEPAALLPNNWIQSDAAEIRQIADTVGHGRPPAEQMRELTSYVRLHMHGRSEFLGYISALEAARSGNGDCTAYALFLAALGRAAQIPTRVAVGMVYSPRFADHNDTFGPHAWAQAWIDGRWVSFDAATEGFDSTHIALAVGQGDPARFATAMGLLPQIDMRAAAEVAAPVAK